MTDVQKINDDASSLVLQLSAAQTGITHWSEDKRKDFVEVFKDRARCSVYILLTATEKIIDAARERYFISGRVSNDLHAKLCNDSLRYHNNYHYNKLSRSENELRAVAVEQAATFISQLPSKMATWEVLAPDVADKMRQSDALEKKLTKLGEELEDLPTEIRMADVDQTMTVGDFRKHVNAVKDQRNSLIKKMNHVTHEGNELRRQVDKALYDGNPELTKAVRALVHENVEKAKGLLEMTRRVEEKILFGDSTHALELLKTFEKDEVKIDEKVKASFTAVLDKLGLGNTKKRKLRK